MVGRGWFFAQSGHIQGGMDKDTYQPCRPPTLSRLWHGLEHTPALPHRHPTVVVGPENFWAHAAIMGCAQCNAAAVGRSGVGVWIAILEGWWKGGSSLLHPSGLVQPRMDSLYTVLWGSNPAITVNRWWGRCGTQNSLNGVMEVYPSFL